MENIVERLRLYLTFKDVSVSAAEQKIGISNASLSKPFKNNTTIKTDTLEKFLNTFDDINPEWLLTGKGNMLKSMERLTYISEPEEKYGINYKELYLKECYTVELQKEIIEKLKFDLLNLQNKRNAG